MTKIEEFVEMVHERYDTEYEPYWVDTCYICRRPKCQAYLICLECYDNNSEEWNKLRNRYLMLRSLNG